MDFTHPGNFLLTALFFFAVILGRYLLVSWVVHSIFYSWSRRKWQARKLGTRDYPKAQLRREIAWSTITTSIFALAGAGMLVMWQLGWLQVYLEPTDYPIIWMPVSLAIAMFLHETAYYFLHRWMHQPRIYRIVHQVHHESSIPSPFTAFSFHPLEGLMQALILPAILLMVPMYVGVLLLYLLIMTASAVINHLDIEVYPKGFHRHRLGKWIIGATHHSMHHKQHRYHFGLFFTFWDRWLQTESPKYQSRFEAATSGTSAKES